MQINIRRGPTLAFVEQNTVSLVLLKILYTNASVWKDLKKIVNVAMYTFSYTSVSDRSTGESRSNIIYLGSKREQVCPVLYTNSNTVYTSISAPSLDVWFMVIDWQSLSDERNLFQADRRNVFSFQKCVDGFRRWPMSLCYVTNFTVGRLFISFCLFLQTTLQRRQYSFFYIGPNGEHLAHVQNVFVFFSNYSLKSFTCKSAKGFKYQK